MPSITLFEHQEVSFQELNWPAESRYPQLLERMNEGSSDTMIDIGRHSIKASHYVGVLRAGDLTVQILPKIDFDEQGNTEGPIDSRMRFKAEDSATSNLLYMLSYAEGLQIREKIESQLHSRRNDWFELLTHFFASELYAQILQGPYRTYMEMQETLPVVRGKWLINRQLTRRPHVRDRFELSFDEFTVDTHLNQIFKFVVERLSSLTNDPLNRRILQSLRALFIDITLPSEVHSASLGRIHFNRRNARFQVAFNFAKMFLDMEALMIATGTQKSFAFLFDMNKLFEKFVESFLQRYRKRIFQSQELVPEIRAQSKGRRVYLAVREMDRRPLVRLKPDLIFSDRKGHFLLILDTKYKRIHSQDELSTLSEGDLYQMIAYLTRFNCQHAMLLYPGLRGNSVKVDSFRIPESDQKIHITSINLHRSLRDPKPLINDFREQFASMPL